jgi:protein-S-isoprenylcysteine O-methyltransferase Ste14
MKRRPSDPPIHPLAPILLAVVAIALLWPLHYFFGIGQPIFDFAVSVGLLFGGILLFTLAVAGLIWCAIKLFGARK